MQRSGVRDPELDPELVVGNLPPESRRMLAPGRRVVGGWGVSEMSSGRFCQQSGISEEKAQRKM